MEFSKDLYMMGSLSSASPTFATNMRIHDYLKNIANVEVFYVGNERGEGRIIKAVKCAKSGKIVTLSMLNNYLSFDLGCIFNNNDFIGSQPFLIKLTPMEFCEPTHEENLVSLAGQFANLNTQIKVLTEQRLKIGNKIKELL